MGKLSILPSAFTEHSSIKEINIIGEKGTFATVYYDSSAGIKEKSWADKRSRLIAAAPELLEALQACADQLRMLEGADGTYTNDDWIGLGLAEKAIAKALGKEE